MWIPWLPGWWMWEHHTALEEALGSAGRFSVGCPSGGTEGQVRQTDSGRPGWHLSLLSIEPLPSIPQHPPALSSSVVPGGTAPQPRFWGFFGFSPPHSSPAPCTPLGVQQLLAQGQPGIDQESRRDGKGQWRQKILQRDGSEPLQQLQEGGKSQSKHLMRIPEVPQPGPPSEDRPQSAQPTPQVSRTERRSWKEQELGCTTHHRVTLTVPGQTPEPCAARTGAASPGKGTALMGQPAQPASSSWGVT